MALLFFRSKAWFDGMQNKAWHRTPVEIWERILRCMVQHHRVGLQQGWHQFDPPIFKGYNHVSIPTVDKMEKQYNQTRILRLVSRTWNQLLLRILSEQIFLNNELALLAVKRQRGRLPQLAELTSRIDVHLTGMTFSMVSQDESTMSEFANLVRLSPNAQILAITTGAEYQLRGRPENRQIFENFITSLPPNPNLVALHYRSIDGTSDDTVTIGGLINISISFSQLRYLSITVVSSDELIYSPGIHFPLLEVLCIEVHDYSASNEVARWSSTWSLPSLCVVRFHRGENTQEMLEAFTQRSRPNLYALVFGHLNTRFRILKKIWNLCPQIREISTSISNFEVSLLHCERSLKVIFWDQSGVDFVMLNRLIKDIQGLPKNQTTKIEFSFTGLSWHDIHPTYGDTLQRLLDVCEQKEWRFRDSMNETLFQFMQSRFH